MPDKIPSNTQVVVTPLSGDGFIISFGGFANTIAVSQCCDLGLEISRVTEYHNHNSLACNKRLQDFDIRAYLTDRLDDSAVKNSIGFVVNAMLDWTSGVEAKDVEPYGVLLARVNGDETYRHEEHILTADVCFLKDTTDSNLGFVGDRMPRNLDRSV